MTNEATVRLKINEMLEKAGWRLVGGDANLAKMIKENVMVILPLIFYFSSMTICRRPYGRSFINRSL